MTLPPAEESLPSPDTCLDLISRNALNRHRSFIEHIQEVPGIEKSSGSYAAVPKEGASKRSRRRRRPKYFLGGRSSDEEEEEMEERAPRRDRNNPRRYGNVQYLTVGMQIDGSRSVLVHFLSCCSSLAKFVFFSFLVCDL